MVSKDEGEEYIGRVQKIFKAVELICRILQCSWKHIVQLYKPIGRIALRGNPKVNHGLQVLTCQCRLMTGNKYTTLVRGVDSGGSHIIC